MILWEGNFTEFAFKFNMVFHLFHCKIYRNTLGLGSLHTGYSLFRCSIDLSTLEHEETHDKWVDLEDGAGKIHLLFTITGRRSSDLLSIPDLTNYRHDDESTLKSSYALRSSLQISNIDDIGYLEVKIFSAKGLMAADIGGKSDPYTVLELDNLRRQTHIEYKTIAPVWNRVLVMKVTDIHSVLHVTVFDDDRNHRYV